MFVVSTVSPIDEGWEDRDRLIYEAVDLETTKTHNGTASSRIRTHDWVLPTLEKARELCLKLKKIDGLEVMLREK